MYKQTIEAEYYYRLRDISQLKKEHIQQKLTDFISELKPKKLRSLGQNKALHLDCQLIADKLNDAGYDMRVVLKQHINIPWTLESVKTHIFKPVLQIMYQKESTTKIDKNSDELQKIHDVIMRELGQNWHIEYHPFPHNIKKQQEIQELKEWRYPNYPENNFGEIKF